MVYRQSRLLCGCSNSRQFNIFIGCFGPTGRASANLEVVGLRPTWVRIFSHVSAHFDKYGRCGIILSRFRLRGQLQYRSALNTTKSPNKSVWMMACFYPVRFGVTGLIQHISAAFLGIFLEDTNFYDQYMGTKFPIKKHITLRIPHFVKILNAFWWK